MPCHRVLHVCGGFDTMAMVLDPLTLSYAVLDGCKERFRFTLGASDQREKSLFTFRVCGADPGRNIRTLISVRSRQLRSTESKTHQSSKCYGCNHRDAEIANHKEAPCQVPF